MRTNLSSVKANTNVSRKNRSGEVRKIKTSKEVAPRPVSKPERQDRTGGNQVVGTNKQYVQRGGEQGGRQGGLSGGPSITGGTGKKDKRKGRVDKGGSSGSGS